MDNLLFGKSLLYNFHVHISQSLYRISWITCGLVRVFVEVPCSYLYRIYIKHSFFSRWVFHRIIVHLATVSLQCPLIPSITLSCKGIEELSLIFLDCSTEASLIFFTKTFSNSKCMGISRSLVVYQFDTILVTLSSRFH